MTEAADVRRLELGAVFGHAGVAAAYRHRPPYPAEAFDILERLVVDEPRAVLDLGAGEGAIARPLAARVDRVDAVDPSVAMIEAGRSRTGGDRPNLRWIVGTAETAELDGPYALVTAGASMHWMQWEETFERLTRVLTPNAQLAIIEHGPRAVGWQDGLLAVIKRHSRNPAYDPSFSMIDALQEQGFLDVTGTTETSPLPFEQSVADYIEQFHSTSTLAREHMTADESAAFDRAIDQLVQPWARDGILQLPVVATITWGRPQPRG